MGLSDQFPEQEARDPFNEAILQLDLSREAFFDASEQFVNRPGSKHALALTDTAAGIDLSLADVLKTVATSGMTQEQQANTIATLLSREDEERIARFRGLLPLQEFDTSQTSRDEMVEIILEMLEIEAPDDDFIEALMDRFHEKFTSDLEDLFEGVTETRQYRWKALSRAAGKQAIDVLKISAGVAIGSVVARRLSR